MIYYLADHMPWQNRTHALTYELVFWIYTRDRNHAVVGKMLRERLGHFNALDGDAMDLDEVDELMDCQLALDSCRSGRDLSSPLARLLRH
ncbi:hypothetical protein F4818DRAFT_408717 [Hypoxylon cercidicola]|nr:hypothetical protein F4818DRAFT_408717 [Hypoxylon cercidicola]